MKERGNGRRKWMLKSKDRAIERRKKKVRVSEGSRREEERYGE